MYTVLHIPIIFQFFHGKPIFVMESFVTVLWRHPRKSATSRSCRMMATDIKWLFGTFLRAWCSMVAFSIGPRLCNWNDTQKSIAVNYPGGTQNPGLITLHHFVIKELMGKEWKGSRNRSPKFHHPTASLKVHIGTRLTTFGIPRAKSGSLWFALSGIPMSPPTSHEPTKSGIQIHEIPLYPSVC